MTSAGQRRGIQLRVNDFIAIILTYTPAKPSE
jgi:hypothetical protein